MAAPSWKRKSAYTTFPSLRIVAMFHDLEWPLTVLRFQFDLVLFTLKAAASLQTLATSFTALGFMTETLLYFTNLPPMYYNETTLNTRRAQS